jgi:hypothetical protein
MRHVGQHANHTMGPVVHLEQPADNRWIRAEFLPPIPVAEHEHGLGAMLIIGLDEAPPQKRRDTQQVEEVV